MMLPPPSVDQQGESISCPSLAFSLRHSKTNSWVVFDLGIRRDLEGYTPLSQERIKALGFAPVVDQTVAESLVKGGVSPDQVETVIISHLHWDQWVSGITELRLLWEKGAGSS